MPLNYNLVLTSLLGVSTVVLNNGPCLAETDNVRQVNQQNQVSQQNKIAQTPGSMLTPGGEKQPAWQQSVEKPDKAQGPYVIPSKDKIPPENKVEHRDMAASSLDLSPLNLSDEQKQKLQTQFQATAVKLKELRQALAVARLALRDDIYDPKSTESQIKKQQQVVSDIRNQMSILMLSDFIAIRNTLTPEQMKLLPQIKQQHGREQQI